ncbi:hypothetical protein [Natronomonas marina]|jgi:uncharacterized protein YceK|uniref:hypothetical protein n=1 Tax=Natronomonas marina TaxID=2961939 RepID=UPI0020C9B867|nr:hypothetical protein [Natronomonas marina]
MQPSTRSVAVSLLLCGLVLTAGCSAIQSNEQSATSLILVNQDDVAHAVVVEIGALADDPDPVYAAGRTVDAESDVDIDPFEETGEYEVKITVDGESTVRTHTFDGEGSATTTTIGIDEDGDATVGSAGSDRNH